MTKLLFITQKIDNADPILGFVTEWVALFSKEFQSIKVICLEKGEYSLPQNVQVFSLGKEEGAGRFCYLIKFFNYIWTERNNYEAVFVHMNQEYVLLGGLFWRIMRKPIILWYNHTVGTWKTKVAMIIANALCHTSPFAFTAETPKSHQMPAGIDTEFFKGSEPSQIEPGSLLYLGRISPLKRVHILIDAILQLLPGNKGIKLDIYGAAGPLDTGYLKMLQSMVNKAGAEEQVAFRSSVPHDKTPEIFSRHEVFVNLTPAGNFDKTVLEAMSCQSLVLVSSPAFADIVPEELRFSENDSAALADALSRTLALPANRKLALGIQLRRAVQEKHELLLLSKKLHSLVQSLIH